VSNTHSHLSQNTKIYIINIYIYIKVYIFIYLFDALVSSLFPECLCYLDSRLQKAQIHPKYWSSAFQSAGIQKPFNFSESIQAKILMKTT